MILMDNTSKNFFKVIESIKILKNIKNNQKVKTNVAEILDNSKSLLKGEFLFNEIIQNLFGSI